MFSAFLFSLSWAEEFIAFGLVLLPLGLEFLGFGGDAFCWAAMVPRISVAEGVASSARRREGNKAGRRREVVRRSWVSFFMGWSFWLESWQFEFLKQVADGGVGTTIGTHS